MFQARLPVLLSEQIEHKKITKKIYDTLPAERRTVWTRYPGPGYNYNEIIHLTPYPNPAIVWLKKKLTKQKMKFKEYEETDEKGVVFLNIESI